MDSSSSANHPALRQAHCPRNWTLSKFPLAFLIFLSGFFDRRYSLFSYYCVAVSYAYFSGVFVSDKSDIETELYQVTYTPPELPKRLLNNSRGTIVASFTFFHNIPLSTFISLIHPSLLRVLK